MTKTKAIKILQRYGFELHPELQKYIAETIRHPMTDGRIHGRIYSDSIQLQLKLEKPDTMWFNLSQGSSSKDFERRVADLSEELKHYDEILRRERVQSIKKYFNDRKLRRA